MDTHYAKSKTKTLCGRDRPKAETVKEFGEVSCRTCNKIIRNAGLKVLGIKA